MNETVECPYCEYENDMSERTVDLPDDHKFDHECDSCEEEFEVFVEFEPSYSAGKIEYGNCQKCGTETRDICEKGRIFPYPKHLKETKICRPCFYKAYAEELESEVNERQALAGESNEVHHS
ncbi:hypothetical protein SAMN05216389_12610 [Oceanobacillus limi]|uniref:Uncharacterized protein n=1 Tax=Oceanobacillus limi TaxID=930131 RepID=A0A1I0H1G8_9BACI|nr:hypothetical protein [Oceanobacillus limi]SET76521.1 hypothetical protein SAMN05216389_12610 [Oceanobacillus limi]